MKILIRNIEEYVLFLCCLSAEVDIADFYESGPYSYEYKRRNIPVLTANKMVRKFKYKETERQAIYHNTNPFGCISQLRMTKARGEGAAMKVSPELLLHYNLIAPETGRTKNGTATAGRFSGTVSHIERQRRLSKIIQHFHYNGMLVDMLQIELEANLMPDAGPSSAMFDRYIKDKTIFASDGTLLPPEEIVSRLGKKDKCFLTLKALSKLNIKTDKNGKNILFRMLGLLIKADTVYSIYMIGSANETWKANNEQLSELQVQRITGKKGGPGTAGRGAAIFYTPDEQVCYDMLIRTNRKENQVLPEKVYEKAYILPIRKATAFLEDLLLIENWEEKALRVLLEESGLIVTPKREYDGLLKGREVYNLLANDLVKMQKAKARAEVQPVILLIQSWQEDMVHDYFGEKGNVIVWSYHEKEIQELYKQVKKLESIGGKSHETT